jgi:hypothetical protein
MVTPDKVPPVDDQGIWPSLPLADYMDALAGLGIVGRLWPVLWQGQGTRVPVEIYG